MRLRRACRRAFVMGASYALTGVTIVATVLFVVFLLIASTVLLPFDIAYRAASEILKS
ncbi:hypothetical protein [Methylovirgula sp. HY1]|uniref:hypothetical protein n=1 Tax=Methylovirgula sp. HY1 TaxID=2822761 RepID=UPI001C5BF0AB|nr:hypothetical protein [Methylovirgula sp. HY1]QXX74218.1 hypothetical protein MHY1_01028 [Methylovirgula sp. HY1]